jgi:hypothetical protein
MARTVGVLEEDGPQRLKENRRNNPEKTARAGVMVGWTADFTHRDGEADGLKCLVDLAVELYRSSESRSLRRIRS